MSAPPASADGAGIETEEGAVVGPLEGVDFRLQPAEAYLGLRHLRRPHDGADDDLPPGLAPALPLRLFRLKLTHALGEALVGDVSP